MIKRARVGLFVALIVATLGFLGILEISVAQLLFYLSLAFAVLSYLFAMFEAEKYPAVSHRPGSITRSPAGRQPQALRLEP